MAKRKKQAVVDIDLATPTEEQLANDNFIRDFVTHVDTNTKAIAYKRRDVSIVDKWIRDGGIGFEEGACRVIADCRYFWAKIGEPRVTSNYGEKTSPSTGSNITSAEARDEIRHMSKGIPPAYWAVFENVVRFEEPAGVVGSRFYKTSGQAIASAKVITGFVASLIATRLGY